MNEALRTRIRAALTPYMVCSLERFEEAVDAVMEAMGATTLTVGGLSPELARLIMAAPNGCAFEDGPAITLNGPPRIDAIRVERWPSDRHLTGDES